MEIVIDYPPNYDSILRAFPAIKDLKNVFFCYGRQLYNPHNEPIDEPLMHHEATHSIQQDKIGPSKWWRKYNRDKDFRLKEELMAFRNQYVMFCKVISDESKRINYLHDLAMNCSSDVYGKMISYNEAKVLIKQ
jgi:hypothetical protein